MFSKASQPFWVCWQNSCKWPISEPSLESDKTFNSESQDILRLKNERILGPSTRSQPLAHFREQKHSFSKAKIEDIYLEPHF